MEKKSNFQWPEHMPDRIQTILEAFLGQDSIPQAFLLLGGVHSQRIAIALAENIVNKKFPNIDTVVFDASTEEAKGIESIREVLRLASLMPVAAHKKPVVMLNMDLANNQMMNALLKNLEEPPQHTVFILQSARPLLPTIMSRCQVINFPEIQDNDLAPELSQALQLLESNRAAGLAERLALVNTLADLDDALLSIVIDRWLRNQAALLKTNPEKFPSVRSAMDTLVALRGNYNKKLVLQNFVTTALI